MKIAIVGGPKSGKTTLAKKLSENVVHTDDYIKNHSFKEAPYACMEDLKDKDNYLVEGTQVARMLRRGLNPDVVIKLDLDFGRDSKQESFAKGIDTVFNEWYSSIDKTKGPSVFKFNKLGSLEMAFPMLKELVND